MPKGGLTTSVDGTLIKKLQLYSIQNDTSVTSIIEFLNKVDNKK